MLMCVVPAGRLRQERVFAVAEGVTTRVNGLVITPTSTLYLLRETPALLLLLLYTFLSFCVTAECGDCQRSARADAGFVYLQPFGPRCRPRPSAHQGANHSGNPQ